MARTYAATMGTLTEHFGQPKFPGAMKIATRIDGKKIGFKDALFACGCRGLRSDPGDVAEFIPCSPKHEQIAIDGRWISSRE